MKINLNKSVLDLDGNELPNSNMGKIVAQKLAFATDGDALKLFEWALKLHKGEVLDLDKSDQLVFKEFITNNPTLPNITKSQVLDCMVVKE